MHKNVLSRNDIFGWKQKGIYLELQRRWNDKNIMIYSDYNDT